MWGIQQMKQTSLAAGAMRATTPPPPTVNPAWLNSLVEEDKSAGETVGGVRSPRDGTRTPLERYILKADADISVFSEQDIWKMLKSQEQDSLTKQISGETEQLEHSKLYRAVDKEDFQAPPGLPAFCGAEGMLSTGSLEPPLDFPLICQPVAYEATQRYETAQQSEEEPGMNLNLSRLSVGSIGHPHSCASACRYVKRHSGCREGVLCQSCHLCFWQRSTARLPGCAGGSAVQEPVPVQMPGKVPRTPEPAPLQSPQPMADAKQEREVLCEPAGGSSPTDLSVGTRGHPFTCGDACKYVRRKTGCRDGANCTQCHLCQWRRGTKSKKDGGHAEPAPVSKEVVFSTDACENLRNLIRLQLYCKTRDSDSPSDDSLLSSGDDTMLTDMPSVTPCTRASDFLYDEGATMPAMMPATTMMTPLVEPRGPPTVSMPAKILTSELVSNLSVEPLRW